MRIWLPVSLYLLLITATTLYAAENSINGTTLLRFEQRSLPGFNKESLVPATQYLSLETTKIGDPNLSFHLNAWGRADLADNSTGKSSDGTLTYGYLRYLFPKANGEIKAGRLFVFEGVSSENLDGVYAKSELAEGFVISAFGGAPVHPASSVDNRGNYIAGGRLGYVYPSLLEIGFSTIHESGGMISGPVTKLRDTRQLVGGDFWLKPHQILELRGKLSYDTVNQGVAEQSWLMALKADADSRLSIDYSQYEFKEYFAGSSIRSLFNPDTPGGQKTIGASYTRQLTKPLEITALYKHFDRDSTGSSDRFGLEGRASLFDGKGLSGISYFRVKAPSGINSFHETRAYLLYTQAAYSASIDGIVHVYDDKINGKSSGFELQGSGGYLIMQNLNLSCDISYAQNPAYTGEVKGLVRLNYNYSTVKGAAK